LASSDVVYELERRAAAISGTGYEVGARRRPVEALSLYGYVGSMNYPEWTEHP
jgi:hypothetical protein